MKNILIILFFVSTVSFGQSSDATIQGHINSNIKAKPFAPKSYSDILTEINNSKVSLLGSYADPAWITSLSTTKLTGLSTTAVPEGSNLYFTNSRAQAAISLTTTGTSGAATYSSGVLNIPNYTTSGTPAGSTTEVQYNNAGVFGSKSEVAINNSAFTGSYGLQLTRSGLSTLKTYVYGGGLEFNITTNTGAVVYADNNTFGTSLNLQAGTVTSGNNPGGDVQLAPGSAFATGTGNGGNVVLNLGTKGSGGTLDGQVKINFTSDALNISHGTNSVSLSAANGSAIGEGMTISAGSSTSGNNNGGVLSLSGGLRSGSGTNGYLSLSGIVTHPSVTLSTISTTQNNYYIGAGSIFKIDASGGTQQITGIQEGLDGRILIVRNTGSTNVINFNNEDAGSTAINRIHSSTGATLSLNPGKCLMLFYDSSINRWVDISF